MLVYGDIERSEVPAAMHAVIRSALEEARHLPPGLDRHAALMRAFLCTAELVQGLADAEFSRTGYDGITPSQARGARLLRDMAACLVGSWTDPGAPLDLPADWSRRLAQLDGCAPIRVRQPEGYAHYALYPEAYIEAARRSGLGPDTVVIGIRSIGTSLSAIVAAALGAKPALTLRPAGHPFARRVALSPALEAALLARPGAEYAIVDEGPGLSGSSFNCVADWLEAQGVAPRDIHFFPGHGGDPGRHAAPEHRQRWANAPRHVVGFDDFLPPAELAGWIADRTGPLDAPLTDISGGVWRTLRCASERDWPPADRQMERRKFLAKSRGRTWLVKFTGIGDIGTRKLARAKALAAEDFVPPPLALRHGFLIEPWIDVSQMPLESLDRHLLLTHVARYLTARARHLPAPSPGAPVDALFAMAIGNTGECLGDAARDRIANRLGDPARLAPLIYPVATDNRMHAWEWLVTPEGRLLKADALDHCVGHDLIGCQDISWDIAGAAIELGLTGDERTFLASEIAAHSGRRVEPGLIEPMACCYLAFQIGLWTDAGERCGPDEAPRIEAILSRYIARLSALAG